MPSRNLIGTVFDVFSIAEQNLLKTHPCLVMVSGGPDSIFLFHAFLKLRQDQNIRFTVLHFNHGLRGPVSDDEADFVRDLCQKNSVPLEIIKLHAPSRGNLQNWGRTERYQKALKYAAHFGFQMIATAHHADDNWETLAMKKTRGTGLAGFCGIRRLQKRGKITLFRPLLDFTKKEILDALRDHHLTYCQDATNASKRYFRNRVRHHFDETPLSASQKKSGQSYLKFLNAADAYFDLRLHALCRKKSYFWPEENWTGLSQEMQFRLLKTLAKNQGWQKEWQTSHFDSILKIPSQLSSGNLTIQHDQNGFWFLNPNSKTDLGTQRQIPGPGHYKIGFLKIHVSHEEFCVNNLKNKDIYISKSVKFPLKLGTTDLRETFHSFGKKRPEPLSAFFSHKKVGIFTRQHWPVLKNFQGEIVAVPGWETGEMYRVMPGETRAYRMRIAYR